MTSRPGTASASSRRSSASLPLLRVASSNWVVIEPWSSGQGLLLELRQLRAAADGEVEQLVEGCPVEDGALCRALHLDEAAVAGADDVHVGSGAHVLFV